MTKIFTGLLTVLLFPFILLTTLIVGMGQFFITRQSKEESNDSPLLRPTTRKLAEINVNLASAAELLETEHQKELRNFMKEHGISSDKQ